MKKYKALKEIALDILEKYKNVGETVIYEYSGSIGEDLAKHEWECDVFRMQIEELAEPKWIPVTERLPDPYTDVLVSVDKRVWIDSLEDDFDSNGNYVVWWDSFNFVDFDKTAWMPLPDCYVEEQKCTDSEEEMK